MTEETAIVSEEQTISRNRNIVLAFAIVYIAWGATYFAIRVAIETLPPLLMAGIRFALAGIFIQAWIAVFRRQEFVIGSWKEWKDSTISGALLILGGNGCVTLAERSVPSGVAALTIALMPVWLVVLDWVRPNGVKPSRSTVLGLTLGLIGVGFLFSTRIHVADHVNDFMGFVLLLVAGLSWASGALYSRYAKSRGSAFLPIGRQMMSGGILMALVGVCRQEYVGFQVEQISMRSFLAFLYLLIFGSLLGYTAYLWLMKVSTPSLVGTTAYVNPTIAVLLGVCFGNETLTFYQAIGGGAILVAVLILTLAKKPKLAKALS